MTLRKIFHVIVFVVPILIRLGIGLALMASSLPKLMHPYDFLNVVLNYEVVGARLAVFVAAVLPMLQLAIGVSLITGFYIDAAIVNCIALFTLFSGALGSVLWRQLNVNCGCFSAEEKVSYFTLFRALFILLLAVSLLLFRHWQHKQE